MDNLSAGSGAAAADCDFFYLYIAGKTGLIRAAEAAGLQVVEIAPGPAEARASRGMFMSVAVRDAEAAAAFTFKKTVRLSPGLLEAGFSYARYAFASGGPEKAAEFYE